METSLSPFSACMSIMSNHCQLAWSSCPSLHPSAPLSYYRMQLGRRPRPKTARNDDLMCNTALWPMDGGGLTNVMCLRPAVPQQSRCQGAVVVQELNYHSCFWREARYTLASSSQGCHIATNKRPGQFRVANFSAKEIFCNTLQESLCWQ